MRNTSRVEPLIHTWQQRSAAGDDLIAFVPMRFAQHPPFGERRGPGQCAGSISDEQVEVAAEADEAATP